MIGNIDTFTNYMKSLGYNIECYSNSYTSDTNREFGYKSGGIHIKHKDMPYGRLNIFGYQSCCGATCLMGMDNSDNKTSEDNRLKMLKDTLKAIKAQKNNFVNYITNYKQSLIEKTLTEVGFQKVFTFTNKNSGNECYFWALDLEKVDL